MTGDGDEVRSQSFGREGDLQKALDRVGVEQGFFVDGLQTLGDVCNGIDAAQLVVHHHHGHQRRVRPHRRQNGFGGNVAVLIRQDGRDLPALLLQLLAAVEDGVVLHGGRHDVLPALAEPLCRGENGPVVGLGAAGGKKDALRLRAQRLRDLRAGGLQALFGIDPERVDGRGIAPGAGQQLGHGIDADLRRLRRGGIVQIDHRWAFFHYR